MDKIIAMYDQSKNIKKSEDFLTKISKAVLGLREGGLIFPPTTPIFYKNAYADGGIVKASDRLKDGGLVYEKGHPIGRKLHMEYVIKDVDSVPAILSPGEFVLTKPMIAKVKKVFKKQGVKLFKGM